ncbi:MAG: hypothetical protein D6704_10155, partial [Nitrospirae bacterium]
IAGFWKNNFYPVKMGKREYFRLYSCRLARVRALFWIFLVPFILGACEHGGPPIVEIALHPTKPWIIYVATNEYIFKSRDEGKTWENISRGMTHSRVIALAIDPLFPANIYAGTKGDAVYKSYNGGQHWSSKRTGLDDVTITSVVHQLVFVPGSSHRIFAATSMGVFESQDAGETWTRRMQGMTEVLMVVTLDFDPNQPQTVYAGTSGGVYKSVNGGHQWQKVNHGLVSPEVLKSSRALGVTRIKVDPHHSDTVYAATLDGLYKTTNGARSWTRIGQSLPDDMFSDLILDHTIPDTLYVASRKGVHKSTDGGKTWQPKNTGLVNLNIRALAMSPQDSQVLYAGTNRAGLFRSRNGGDTWEAVPLIASPTRTASELRSRVPLFGT